MSRQQVFTCSMTSVRLKIDLPHTSASANVLRLHQLTDIEGSCVIYCTVNDVTKRIREVELDLRHV